MTRASSPDSGMVLFLLFFFFFFLLFSRLTRHLVNVYINLFFPLYFLVVWQPSFVLKSSRIKLLYLVRPILLTFRTLKMKPRK